MSLPTDTDGDGIYDPTTFSPGTAPGISAAQLNKIGQGIRDGQLQARAANDAATAANAAAVVAAGAGLPTALLLMGG